VKPRILFVEDEATLRDMLVLYLQHKGCEVETAVSVQRAKDSLEQSPFDLVILDLGLAGEDGLEVLHFSKARTPSLPVVIFTGLEMNEHLVRSCLQGQADGFMRKTEGFAKLFAEIRRHLPGFELN
jgi:DNA-binding response OmpR family regulator